MADLATAASLDMVRARSMSVIPVKVSRWLTEKEKEDLES
jgi:hypothetical protein